MNKKYRQFALILYGLFKYAVCLLIIIGFLFYPSRADSYKLFWKCISSSGFIQENRGVTLGQTATDKVGGGTEFYTGSYGFWYLDFIPEVCLNVTPDSWEIDTVNLMETITMATGEQLLVENCSNCHINLGFEFVNSLILPWNIGSLPGTNRFVIRAHFTESLTPPSVYDPGLDFISDAIVWADGERFGYAGYDVNILQSVYLWLQFISPTESSSYGENEVLINILGQTNLP
ncbi:hypothetical protein JXI42_10220 [bacterium]|nr:hypothetical protein [bacterium]